MRYARFWLLLPLFEIRVSMFRNSFLLLLATNYLILHYVLDRKTQNSLGSEKWLAGFGNPHRFCTYGIFFFICEETDLCTFQY